MSKSRLRVTIGGAVQGVGFRPFVYRLAMELSLDGWVKNDPRGVVVEVEGLRPDLETFLGRLPRDKPAPAVVQSIHAEWLDRVGFRGFTIRDSDSGGAKRIQVLPDIATCPACLRDIEDPADRRHRYPFTNCTHCGPRLSIVQGLPYDRPRTTMSGFVMCPECRSEYEDPVDRRFHAQPTACPDCGPQLSLWDRSGRPVAEKEAALLGAAEALRSGCVVAVKGLGGFHLMVDARNGETIARLRAGKPRREKPLALMVHDLGEARRLCVVDAAAAALLQSPEAPIVLLPRASSCDVHDQVAPGRRDLGIMLPYTPLHRLLMDSIGFPVVATSGNLSNEPICIDEAEAVERLGAIAERFLVHDRPIARHVDDSVVWIVGDGPAVLRRARGYAPRPVLLEYDSPRVLAVGAHLKNTVALSVGRQVFVSQHIGDMETPQSSAAFERVVKDFLNLYDARPQAVACDMHPDYATSRWARATVGGTAGRATDDPLSLLSGLPLFPVQHHHAHLAACLAEHEVEGRTLGVTWDGTGYGTDGTVWGGEFLVGDAAGFRRVASLRPFALPGGEVAVREPCRSALGMLFESGGADALLEPVEPVRAFDSQDLSVLTGMLARGYNSPRTTSAGRLFDGIAALIGLHQRTSFEGQAAMALEAVADETVPDSYPLDLQEQSGEPGLVLDWSPLLAAVLEDSRAGVDAGIISARFHNAMVGGIVQVADAVGDERVALSGGCFQNRWLLERTAEALRRSGFEVLIHRLLPPNDGGISAGQIAVAAARLRKKGVGSDAMH